MASVQDTEALGILASAVECAVSAPAWEFTEHYVVPAGPSEVSGNKEPQGTLEKAELFKT